MHHGASDPDRLGLCATGDATGAVIGILAVAAATRTFGGTAIPALGGWKPVRD